MADTAYAEGTLTAGHRAWDVLSSTASRRLILDRRQTNTVAYLALSAEHSPAAAALCQWVSFSSMQADHQCGRGCLMLYQDAPCWVEHLLCGWPLQLRVGGFATPSGRRDLVLGGLYLTSAASGLHAGEVVCRFEIGQQAGPLPQRQIGLEGQELPLS